MKNWEEKKWAEINKLQEESKKAFDELQIKKKNVMSDMAARHKALNELIASIKSDEEIEETDNISLLNEISKELDDLMI